MIYLKELKTHARSENKRILIVSQETFGRRKKKQDFFHPVNTHT